MSSPVASAPSVPAAIVPPAQRPAAPAVAAPAATKPAVSVAKPAGRPPAPRPVATAAAPAAQPTNAWARFFTEWPDDLPRRGIVVTQLNETAPFKGFMLSADFVVLQRTAPDALGGRFLILPFDEVSAVKLTDPLKPAVFQSAGFVGSYDP